jgi:RNA polymerase sigma factor for flagellar operon FliA
MDLAQSREENFGKESHLLRNQIINEYLPYVKRIVNRIAVHLPATIEVDDLINVGIIGLIQAIERYDPIGTINLLPTPCFVSKAPC